MGSAQDVMQTFTCMDIRAAFSEYDGWKCSLDADRNHCGILYQISRQIDWKKESAVLLVVFDTSMIPDGIYHLSAIKGENREHIKKYLLVPQNTDVSAVPSDIRIMFMHAFGFVEGRLVWLTKKKNAVRYPVCTPASA